MVLGEGVICAFRSPFGHDFVKLKVDETLTVSQLHDVERSARKFLVSLLNVDDSKVPEDFVEFHLDATGRAAIKLLGATLPDNVVNVEVFGAISGVSAFIEQLVDRVNSDYMMPRDGYVAKTVEFAKKFGQNFVDGLIMQLDDIEDQPKNYLKPADGETMFTRAKRLSKLAKLTRETLIGLPGLMGLDVYADWKRAKFAGRPEPSVDDGIKIGKNGKVTKKLVFDQEEPPKTKPGTEDAEESEDSNTNSDDDNDDEDSDSDEEIEEEEDNEDN